MGRLVHLVVSLWDHFLSQRGIFFKSHLEAYLKAGLAVTPILRAIKWSETTRRLWLYNRNKMWMTCPECDGVVGIKRSPKPSGSCCVLRGGFTMSLGRRTWYEAAPELTHSRLQFVERRMMVRRRPWDLWCVCGDDLQAGLGGERYLPSQWRSAVYCLFSSLGVRCSRQSSILTSPRSGWDCSCPYMFDMIYQWSHLGLEFALCKSFKIWISFIALPVSCPLWFICVF